MTDPVALDSPSPPRILRVVIEGLFGSFNHEVSLERDDRVTIVHGVNGVGKTKLLELTAALSTGRFGRLLKTPFNVLRLVLDDGTTVEARRQGINPLAGRKRKGRTLGNGPGLEVTRLDTASGKPNGRPWTSARAKALVEESESTGSVHWVHFRTGRRRREQADELILDPKERDELLGCAPVHLIETQRLLLLPDQDQVEDDDPFVMAVDDIASELRRKIATVQNDFVQKTQALDRTLTDRVLQANATEDSAGEALRQRLESLETHRRRLEAVGLLDAGTFGPKLAPAAASSLTGDRALMISVHTSDTEEKFKVLDPLATKLDLFLRSINDKLSSPKRVELDKARDLRVRRGDELIELDQLSSGEQHEIVLLYDLVFRIEPNKLVLIDEPELSLHPVWQQQFLDDMIKIAKNGKFDILLATHSPYIIGQRNDLCVELKA